MPFTSFPPGTQVEVRSNDAGFCGAWFEATVLKYNGKQRRYTITYNSLVTEDVPPKPIREPVYLSYVRPRPPGGSRSFELHQLVEAYHNDAWWKGVVAEVPREEGGLYTVRFPLSNEVFQFQGEMIREQVEWVKGNWVRVQDDDAPDQEGDMMFGVGNQVEVSRDKENYGAVWFVGTILKVIGKGYFLVEYKSLRVDDGSNRMLLKEIVDLRYIRPSPPSAPKFDSFNVLDEVEAFHKDGWLVGVVARILPGSRYIVKSKHQDEEIELDQILLRPHFDWTNKHWVPITRDGKAPVSRGKKSAGRKMKTHAVEKANCPLSVLTYDTDGEVAGECNVNLVVEVSKSEGHRVEDVVVTSQHCRKLKKGRLLEPKSAPCRTKQKSQSAKLSSPVTISTSSSNDDEVGDKTGLMNLKKKGVRELHVEDMANLSQPHKKLKKRIPQQEDLLIVDSTLKFHFPKPPKMVENVSFDATAMSEGSPALVNEQNHTHRIYPSGKAGTKSHTFPSVTICNEQDMAGANGYGEQANCGVGSSTVLGDISEPQLKAANIGLSPVAADFLSVAHLGNSEVSPHNIRLRRKKLVTRGPYKKRKISDVVEQCRSNISDNIVEMVSASIDLSPQEDNFHDYNKFTPNSLLSEEAPTDPTTSRTDQAGSEIDNAPSDTTPSRSASSQQDICYNYELIASACQAKKAIAVNVEMVGALVNLSPREDVHDLNKFILSTLPSEKAPTDPTPSEAEKVVSEIDKTPSDPAPRGSSPSEKDICDDDELILNAFFAAKKAINGNNVEMVGSVVDPSPKDVINGMNMFIPGMLPSMEASNDPTPSTTEMAVSEVHKIPSDPAPNGSSPSGNHVCDHEFVPSTCARQKVIGGNIVEMVSASVKSSPNDDVVHDQNKFISSLLLSVEDPPDPAPLMTGMVVSEIVKIPSYPAPTELSPSEKNVFDHNELVPGICPTQKAINETDMVPSGPLSNKITLPFTKGSAMWKILESMEVFHTMPQQPHFQELNNYNVELREGMAFGFMLTFANLVDDIKKLQMTDSQDVIERKIEALVPLELNGFNVQVVRSLLEKLLVIKRIASQSTAKQIFLEGQIVETENTIHELDLSIAEQNKVILKLEEKLQCCREGRLCTLSEKSIKESKVFQLKTDLKDAGKTYRSSEMQFNTTLKLMIHGK